MRTADCLGGIQTVIGRLVRTCFDAFLVVEAIILWLSGWKPV
jgi:hypothetical protein